jgi:hypothetical protein
MRIANTFINIDAEFAITHPASIAGAREGSVDIVARGMAIAIVRHAGAFINVVTSITVSSEPNIARACVRANDVGARSSRSGTTMSIKGTFICIITTSSVSSKSDIT